MLNVRLVNVQLVSDEMNGISEYEILIAIAISIVDNHAPNYSHLIFYTLFFFFFTLYNTFVTHKVCAII